jgi:hypothetical protein
VIDVRERGLGVGSELIRTWSRLKVFTKASTMPSLSGLSTGVKQDLRFKAAARVRLEAKIDPLTVSVWTLSQRLMTTESFCSVANRRRWATLVMTSMVENVLAYAKDHAELSG